MADNPFEPKHFGGLLATLGAEPRRNGLLDYIAPPTPPIAPSLYGSGLGNIFADFAATDPANPSLNALASLLAPAPIFPVAKLAAPPAAPVVRAEPVKRMAYFAFDFDDVIRVNNVRHTGKIGFRVTRNSRGFLDRSVWESRNINTERGLKQLMQGAMKFSSVVCVLIGTNTWFSRWVRYEIALSVVNERGLMAIDLNSLDHHHRKSAERQHLISRLNSTSTK